MRILIGLSATSIDHVHASDEINAAPEVWTRSICDRIDQIIDRKRSSVQGREESLQALGYSLMVHYARDVISKRVSSLIPALIKCAKSGQSESETLAAVRTMGLVIMTDPTEGICEQISTSMRLLIVDAESIAVKTAAVHILGLATFYGGVVESEIMDIMSFMTEIVESDGASVEAMDQGTVVTAALEEWAFLATELDDLQDSSAESMEALVDQLDSSDVAVQIAAGECIALVYEKSYTGIEEDERQARHDDKDSDEEGEPTHMIKRYNAYGNEHRLHSMLESLAKSSTRHMSKRDKRSLHTNFADILNSVQHPTRGPRYSQAINAETGRAYGSRMTVGVGAKSSLRIRTWEQLLRLKALRRVLQGGFLVHYADNEIVFDTLPIMLQGE